MKLIFGEINHFFLVLVLILALFLRIFNLESLPIFNDEADYLLTSREVNIFKTESWRLSFEGPMQKPPLLFLITGLFLQNGDQDLVIARCLSVFFGFLTIIIVFFLTLNLWGKREAFYTLLLFSFSPFLVFYQRLFLIESLFLFLTLLVILILSLSLSKNRLYLNAFLVILAFLLVAIKQSVFLWLPSVLLFQLIASKKVEVKSLAKSAFFVLFGSLMGIAFFSFLVGFDTYFVPKENFITSSFSYQIVVSNFIATLIWVKSYFAKTGFFIVLAVILFSFVIRILEGKQKRYFLFLFLILLPVFLQILMAKYFFARYIFVSFAFFLIFVAGELAYLYQKLPFLAILPAIAISISFLLFDIKIVSNVIKAPFHENERWQYISGWPSGWGVEEISKLIIAKGEVKRVASIGERMMPTNGLRFYLEPEGIEIVSYSGDFKEEEIREDFLVLQTEGETIAFKEFEKVIEIAKPGREIKIGLWQKSN